MPSRYLPVLAMAAIFAASPATALVPTGFQDLLVQGSLGGPTALAFTPDGRLLITRQTGVLRVYAGGALVPAPALNLATKVCSSSERGLLGVAVDPNFPSNGFVYLYYTVDKAGTCFNRVSRFVLPASNVINSATEVVLLDNIRSTAGNHNAGDLNFGKDGYLYVSVGDGGCDYLTPFGCGGANQASRNPNTLLGKILRITRDGNVPPDNPYLGTGTASCKTGDVATGVKCQETFASGLRNPFRFAMDPAAAGVRFFINDVGQNAWEEIDLGAKGADYGWNCREGAHANAEAGSKCSPLPGGLTGPIFEYPHSSCGSITGGAFLPSGSWPASHDGSYFYSDYNCGTIFELAPVAGGGYTSSEFVTGLGASSAVHLVFGPYLGGLGLYYTNYQGGGEVRVIAFTGAGNRAPQAKLAASPIKGARPLLVTFDATGSSDPDGDPLTYVWDFGDGSPVTETTTITTTHTYGTDGVFTAILRAKDPLGAVSSPATLVVNVGNTPPVPTITAPAAGELYRVGQSVTLVGFATDADEGGLPDSKLTWNVLIHHDAHTHPFLTDVVGNNVGFVTRPPEDLDTCLTGYLEIRLTATDSAGAQTTVVQNFDPRKVAVRLETSPSGLTLEVNSTPFVTPTTITSWDNYVLRVNAPDQAPYAFRAWSDEGTQAHDFATPSAATTLGAAFGAPVSAPEAVLFLAVTSVDQQNHVEWLNPSDPSFESAVLVFRTGRFPTTPSDGTTLFTGGVAGDKTTFDHGGLTNGVTYYYATFVNLVPGGTSAGTFSRGRPFDTNAGPVKWAYSTGATSLAPPGLGASILAVSNDRVIHALSRGASGGTWPSSFVPLMLGGVAQSRPPVVSAGLVAGHPSVAFMGAQDGIVYAVDAESGASVWQSTTLGEGVQASPAGLFVAFGASFDRLLLGTRNATLPNRFYSLDAKTGFTVGVPYEGADGGGLGIVSGGAAVDYPTSRVYFASRAAAPGASTVWCLEVTPGGFIHRWSQPIGDVDGSPVVRGDRVYVGGNDGVVHAFDKITGTQAWFFNTGAQPFKGFLFPDRGSDDLYVATTSRVFGLSDNGTSASLNWSALPAPSPSIVLFAPSVGAVPARLYFGGGDRKLHELDLSRSPPTEKTVLLGGTAAAIGSPTLDAANGLIYVGSEAGIIYAVAVPLP